MTALRLGLSLTEYEAITPAELAATARAHRRREAARRQEREESLYLLACMTGCAVWGKLERYEAIFGKKQDDGGMTDEQMLAQVRALNAAFGGTNSFDGEGGENVNGNQEPDGAYRHRHERVGRCHRQGKRPF